jgi:hypothetical protein
MGLSGFCGPQPFDLWGAPLWFGFVDATGGVVLGATTALLGPYLTGRRILLVAVLPTLVYRGVLGGTTGPLATALNSPTSTTAVWLAATLTVGLGLAAVLLLSWVLPMVTRSRADTPGRRECPALSPGF